MKSYFLPKKKIENLAEEKNIDSFIIALSKTAYRKAIEVALTITSDLACVNEALRRDSIEVMAKIREYYYGKVRKYIAIILLRNDLQNVKAIMRGLSQNNPPDEIFSALLPVGEIQASILTQLTQLGDQRTAIDLMTTLSLPFAQPLLKLRTEFPDADVPTMELALEKWYFKRAQFQLRKIPKETVLLRQSVDLEADIINMLTVLRFVHAPNEHNRLNGNIIDIFVGPGSLSFQLLEQFSQQNNLYTAVNIMTDTPYVAPLLSGLESYKDSGRLSDFESHFRLFRLRWMERLILKHPLGIGVPLGYMALKFNEISNIRWIAKGIHLGIEPSLIKANLELI